MRLHFRDEEQKMFSEYEHSLKPDEDLTILQTIERHSRSPYNSKN